MWHLTILGQCQQATGDLASAVVTLKDAAQKGPRSPFPRVCLADALVETGDTASATAVAKEITRLERNFSLARWRGAYFRDAEARRRSLERLREAGLPA